MKIQNGILLFTITCAVLCGCGDGGPSAEHQAYLKALSEVKVASPIMRKMDLWDEYTAKIEAVAYVELRARVNGYLEKIYFTEGQEVKKGDVLFLIDPRPYEAALDSAKANVKEVEARLVLAKHNLERAKELYAANAISKETLDTRESSYMQEQAYLLSAKANLRDAELNLEFTEIKAPMDGRVSETMVDVGNLVTANSTLLTTIVRSDVVQAYIEISERDFQRYQANALFKLIDIKAKKGPDVEVLTLGDDKTVYKGHVTYYDNRIGNETASLTMRADLDNSDGKLAGGMFAKLRMRSGEPQMCMILPESVIGTDLLNRYVLVVDKDNVVRYKAVQIGRLVGEYRIIEGGLNPQDKVVFEGLQRAVPGTKVTPIPYEHKEKSSE